MKSGQYYAIVAPGIDTSNCLRVCRSCDAGFEEYNYEKDEWFFNVELFLIHAGEPEAEPISEETANEIIERVKRLRKSVVSGN